MDDRWSNKCRQRYNYSLNYESGLSWMTDGAINVDRDITTLWIIMDDRWSNKCRQRYNYSLNYESGLSWMTDGAINVDRDITTLWIMSQVYHGWQMEQ